MVRFFASSTSAYFEVRPLYSLSAHSSAPQGAFLSSFPLLSCASAHAWSQHPRILAFSFSVELRPLYARDPPFPFPFLFLCPSLLFSVYPGPPFDFYHAFSFSWRDLPHLGYSGALKSLKNVSGGRLRTRLADTVIG